MDAHACTLEGMSDVRRFVKEVVTSLAGEEVAAVEMSRIDSMASRVGLSDYDACVTLWLFDLLTFGVPVVECREKMNLPEQIVEALEVLGDKTFGESMGFYFARVSSNLLAVKVWLAMLEECEAAPLNSAFRKGTLPLLPLLPLLRKSLLSLKSSSPQEDFRPELN